jgi:hypothetical protein
VIHLVVVYAIGWYVHCRWGRRTCWDREGKTRSSSSVRADKQEVVAQLDSLCARGRTICIFFLSPEAIRWFIWARGQCDLFLIVFFRCTTAQMHTHETPIQLFSKFRHTPSSLWTNSNSLPNLGTT